MCLIMIRLDKHNDEYVFGEFKKKIAGLMQSYKIPAQATTILSRNRLSAYSTFAI